MTPTSSFPARGRLYQEHLSLPPGRGIRIRQYTLAGVLGTWAAAALPMAALAWIVAPWLASTLDGPTAWPRALLVCLTAGLVWQFVLVLVLVYREQGTLRWSVVQDALWLHRPQRPDGRRMGWAWLVLVLLVVAIAAKEALPNLPMPANRDMGLFLGSDAGQSFLSGNWTWLAVILAMGIFNTVLGEELLFRGLLLPRMNGVFGRGDWVANGLLFTGYHLHVPWAMPATLFETFFFAYPTKRYRSAWIGIAAHSAQSVILGLLLLTLVA